MNEKKLGFGLMRLPLSDPDYWGSVDKEETREMIDYFMALKIMEDFYLKVSMIKNIPINII